MNRNLLATFQNPGSAFRGAPFWAWNGKLEPEELRRQIRLMKRMGLGGFFMHSRVGLDTAYLSKDWFDCVKACVDEAEKLDMQAWLYDEDRWPSGAAGGLVTRNPEYRRRSLVLTTCRKADAFAWTPDTVAAFTARLDGHTAWNVQPLSKTTTPPRLAKDETILAFTVKVDEGEDWYNGYTYLDTLNHDAVRAFIEATHERYRREIGDQLGKRVPGIFTDEPNHAYFLGFRGGKANPSVPWTAALPSVFQQRYGYDILPRLVEVFYDVDGETITPARWHFHDCTTFLFVDAFARQIGAWCDANGFQHTGHVLAEETLSSQTGSVGSALRFYEYMQAPGMDILTEYRREYDTAKGVSSVARQFGRQWRLTETYGCTGWDFPFEAHKAIGDWQAALGINLRCQHLAWYTMEGQAKRDYPASIFYQSPWWESYTKVEDYFARIHAVMTRGQEVRDVLVIWPIESTWVASKFTAEPDPAIDELNRALIALRDALLSDAIDFDYGDEDILARHGRVRAAKDSAPTLRVAKAVYKAVVVPPMKTMRASTLRLLKRFRAAGGTVVFAGEAPRYVDALPSEAAVAFATAGPQASAQGPDLPAALDPVGRRIHITDGSGQPIVPALHLLREDSEAYYCFVCNTGAGRDTADGIVLDPHIQTDTMIRDRRRAFSDVRIRGFADCVGKPLELDPATGSIYTAQAERHKAGWEVRTNLPALGSRLFVIPKKAQPNPTWPKQKPHKTLRTRALAPETWDIQLSERNALVLDRPEFRIGPQGWQPEMEILHVDRQVRDAMGLPHRGGRMVQPWARTRAKHPKQETVTLRYAFDVNVPPSGELYLAIERPDTFAASLNGEAVSMDAECGWWCDRSLRRIPLDVGTLRKGRNELTLTCAYAEDHPGLEIVYLLGAFGIRLKGTEATLLAPPSGLTLGDWTQQGLPFYSGSVGYKTTIRPRLKPRERLWVRVPSYRGVAARVLVNGRSAGVIAWEPSELDVTDLLAQGANELAIEVLGHRRNSHGPLHHTKRWQYWTGPQQFTSWDKNWRESYSLVPCGLMEPPRLVVTD